MIKKLFECWIDEIVGDIIYARGTQICNNEVVYPQIIFELDINHINVNDKSMIVEGAVFIVEIEENIITIQFKPFIETENIKSKLDYKMKEKELREFCNLI